jgi:hypothetical protein
MNLPFSLGTLPLPAWLPAWAPAVLLVPIGLYVLLALLVPFGTFGVKSRLDDIEVQLDEVRADVREILQRLAPPQEARLRDVTPPRPEAGLRARSAEARLERRPIGLRAEPRLGPGGNP